MQEIPAVGDSVKNENPTTMASYIVANITTAAAVIMAAVAQPSHFITRELVLVPIIFLLLVF